MPASSAQNTHSDALRDSIETMVLQLFSSQPATVEQVLEQAKAIAESPGIDSFFTPLPWKISLPEGAEVRGDAMNLRDAVQTIQAHLQQFMDNPSAQIRVSIESERLTREGTAKQGGRGGIGG